jgi:muramoyltetrapeptide carboxypeptidase
VLYYFKSYKIVTKYRLHLLEKKQSPMYIPPYLQKGDKVAIIAPVRKVSESEIADAISLLGENFEVILAPHIYAVHHQFGGTDAERSADLQWALDAPEIKAVFIARGGYGLMRIIDNIDFSEFVAHPKWIVGYSDVTVLHAHIQQNFNICSLHATMPFQFSVNEKATQLMIQTLMGKPATYSYTSALNCINGKNTATLLGGNLSLLYALSGSTSDINTDGKFLFMEDLDEYLYHIDRMLLQLKRSNKFEKLSGLIIGGMSDMKDNTIPFGYSVHNIIYNIAKRYQFPVAFDFPAGHIKENMPIILGQTYTLEVKDNDVKLYL